MYFNMASLDIFFIITEAAKENDVIVIGETRKEDARKGIARWIKANNNHDTDVIIIFIILFLKLLVEKISLYPNYEENVGYQMSMWYLLKRF